jgi:hypothetical protein
MSAHNYGVCEIFRGSEEACLECLRGIRGAGLGASVTTSYWIMREQQACVVISLLRSICTVNPKP